MPLSSFPSVVPIPYCAVSSLDHSGKGLLGMRVCVLFSLIRTAIRSRLVSFAGASCVVRQNRFFFQLVRRRFGAWSMNDTNWLDVVWQIELTASLGLELSWKYSRMCRGYSWSFCSWLHVGHGPKKCRPQYFPRCSIPPSAISSQSKIDVLWYHVIVQDLSPR